MMIRLGVIGLGCRGYDLLKSEVLLMRDKVKVTAVCDLYEDRIEKGANLVFNESGSLPEKYTDYKKLVDSENVDAVLISCAWESHVEIAVYAMKKGKAVAMEVGGAYSLSDCFDLVKTYEETKTPFMFLENCCFGKRELMVLNMVKKGLFGKVVHCSGGYQHDLRYEISFGKENRHYRLRNYLSRNCENYPTHELGPIAKILDIGKSNRMVSLYSCASGSYGLSDYIRKNKSDDDELMNSSFAQSDIVTTVIKCQNGETIVLTLDTTLPRYYSRGFTVRGTNAMYEEATDSVFVDTKEDRKKDFSWIRSEVGNASKYEDEYLDETWKRKFEGGHGGMDYLEFEAFFDCLINNKPMPIDVYDAAAWMSITPLSEISLKENRPVDIPDFKNIH